MIDNRKPQRFRYWDKGKHGHDRTEQSGRGSEFCASERTSSLARVVICAHHFSGRLSQPARSAFPVGLGLFHLQQRRAIDHAKFPIRDAPTSVKAVNDFAI